jgi:hypothetical protein
VNIDFSKIRRVHLPSDILDQTGIWLRRIGRRNDEAFVLWAGGFRTSEEFDVTTGIFPEQKTIRSPFGVGVRVEGEEIRRISRWLYENNKVLLGQVHSHPTQAFHSDTDDFFPLVTAMGQFSVVVPFFARRPLPDLSGCAVFRLSGYGDWKRLSTAQVNGVFRVI